MNKPNNSGINKYGQTIYTKWQVNRLNLWYSWGKTEDMILNYNDIEKEDIYGKTIYYIVVDIGNANTNGRKSIALKSGTDIKNNYIKNKYNLF
jgi:hypothetical protein